MLHPVELAIQHCTGIDSDSGAALSLGLDSRNDRLPQHLAVLAEACTSNSTACIDSEHRSRVKEPEVGVLQVRQPAMEELYDSDEEPTLLAYAGQCWFDSKPVSHFQRSL